MQRKFTLHTIAEDGVCEIHKLDSIAALPKGEYRLINNHTQRSYASPGFAAAWKKLTLPEFQPARA